MNNHSNELHVVVETITPQIAERMLLGNTHNRNIRPRHVTTLARDMANGNWFLSGDSIKIANDRTILDGQHRLLAVIESETTIQCLVAYNVVKEAQLVMDAGRNRTFADALRLMGESSPNDKGALVRKVLLWEAGAMRGNSIGISRPELLARFLEEKDEFHEAVLMAGRYANRMGATKSVVALAAYLLNQIDPEDAEYFFARAADGQGMVQGDPIYALRRALANREPRDSMTNSWYLMGLILKTWNAYRDGSPIHTLMFRTGGRAPEAMPEPK